MAPPREIRRLAFQALYQIDTHDGKDLDAVRLSLEDNDAYTQADRDAAFATATDAWAQRSTADKELTALAPNWPTHRQAAVDRAILRLAYYEMTKPAGPPPKAVVNDAVELAKEFSTDRSPAFINGVLDKVLKRVLGSSAAEAPATEP